MKQIAWYGFQIAVFGLTAWFFISVRPPQPGEHYGLALFLVCLGVTAIVTALVFWTGRLIARIARWASGYPDQSDQTRINSSGIIRRSQSRELPPRIRIGE